VPAAAVIQRGRALFILTGRKGCVGGHYIEHGSSNDRILCIGYLPYGLS